MVIYWKAHPYLQKVDKRTEILQYLFPSYDVIELDEHERNQWESNMYKLIKNSPAKFDSIAASEEYGQGKSYAFSPYEYWKQSPVKNTKYMDDATLKEGIKMIRGLDKHTKILGYDLLSTLEPHLYFYIFVYIRFHAGAYEGESQYSQFIYNMLFKGTEALTIGLLVNSKWDTKSPTIMPSKDASNYLNFLKEIR